MKNVHIATVLCQNVKKKCLFLIGEKQPVSLSGLFCTFPHTRAQAQLLSHKHRSPSHTHTHTEAGKTLNSGLVTYRHQVPPSFNVERRSVSPLRFLRLCNKQTMNVISFCFSRALYLIREKKNKKIVGTTCACLLFAAT